MITVEAVRNAQAKFGKKPMTGEQVRWGIENLDIDAEAPQDSSAFDSMIPPIKLSCNDHGGSGLVRFQQWTGTQDGRPCSDWIERRQRDWCAR